MPNKKCIFKGLNYTNFLIWLISMFCAAFIYNRPPSFRDIALGLSFMSESSLSVRLGKPDNPLMESTGGYCCLYPPPSPSSTYEDLLKERAKQRGPALTWQATMATGKEAGRTEAGGRHTRGWWELQRTQHSGIGTMIIWLLCGTNIQRAALSPLKQRIDVESRFKFSWVWLCWSPVVTV